MKGVTHVSLAVASNLVVANLMGTQLDIQSFAILSACSTVGGLLPDIDHANSRLGSKVPIFSKIFKHRGFTHTIYFAGIVTLLIYYYNPIVALYIGVGCISHLIGDILTPMGLKPLKIGFNTLDIHICIPVIQNEIIEKAIGYLLYLTIPFLVI